MLPLKAHEEELRDENEMLRRQIHPNHLASDGQACSLVFTPNMSEEWTVSTFRHLHVDEAEARRLHEEDGNETIGHCSVSIEEVQRCGLRAVDDSGDPDVPNGHAYIDMQHLPSKNAVKRAARSLQIASRDSEKRYGEGLSEFLCNRP